MALYTDHPNEIINKSLNFAIDKHERQIRKGTDDLPYVYHAFDTSREIIFHSDLLGREKTLATIAGNLHDVLEDTDATEAEIRKIFGDEITDAVIALSKDPTLSGEVQLRENLIRLQMQPHWVQCVKLADRISNLKVFPNFWNRKKIASYIADSELIEQTLGHVSTGLRTRLLTRIRNTRVTLSIK